MKSILKLLLAALIIVYAGSCTKITDTGITLKIKGISTLPAVKKSTAVEGYTFSEALMGIKEIEIEAESADEESDDYDDVEYEFEGKYVVDLLTGTSSPDLGLADLQPGTYNELEAETAQILEGGNTLILKGTYTDAAQNVHTFEFSTDDEIELEIESDEGFVLTEGEVLDMIVNIYLPMLFEGVDFSTATENADGVIIINDSSNPSLAWKINNNIDHVAEIEIDDDGDDDADDDDDKD